MSIVPAVGYVQHCSRELCGHLSILTSIPCRANRQFTRTASRAGRKPATMATGCIPLPTWTRPPAPASPFRYKNGIVRRASKSIIQMLLQGHQIMTGGLQLSTCFSCSKTVESEFSLKKMDVLSRQFLETDFHGGTIINE